MTRGELQELLLEDEGIPYEWCVYGEKLENDQKTCLAERGDKWLVYYYERGKEMGIKEFDNENDACNELYNRMLEKKEFYKKLRQEGKIK